REFWRLPVIENVLTAGQRQVGEGLVAALFRGTWHAQETELREQAHELLDWVGLTEKARVPASDLSGGQRRLLDIARSLMAGPKLLLLDEPTAGVYPVMVREIAKRIRELPARGIAVVVIAHDADFLVSACDEIVVMAAGRVVARGDFDEVRRRSEVVEAYLGA
ncbi:MAG: ATP-binding cassette domain-containing protein, partial [Acidimicrobiales bacterium]